MQVQGSFNDADARAPVAAWGAVFAMSLCVFVLIASEFMPVSLLTPIASELHMTEGEAGQAISVSGIFAVVTSVFIASTVRRIDRKVLLLALTRPDAGFRNDRRPCGELCRFHDRPGAARHRNRRLLVDVDGDRDAAGAGKIRAESARHPQRWQRTRSNNCGTAR